MKSNFKIALAVLMALFVLPLSAQKNRDLDNYRQPDKRGINVFEAPKSTESTFDGVKVRIGGSSSLQFQALNHENSGIVPLKEIGDNFNLATANLDLDVALYDGIRMHLRTYLSSRHHPEPYVKGGYIQFDKLEFIKEGFLEDFMQYATLKIGHMENNYGDAHFRRSDNAQAIYNPFVGNLIMDAFTTEVGAELYYQRNGFIGMMGVTNGKLNQGVDNPGTGGASFIAKLGYDKQFDNDLRFRLTGSIYNTGFVRNSYLYSADRAGSRYYLVLEDDEASARSNFRSGRYNPGLRNQITAIMINPFVKYKGLEFFGTFETASGKADSEAEERTATQFSTELIYRFGNDEKFFIGGRYNKVDAEDRSEGEIEISRFQLGAGWFMTKNILAKFEYVNQKHDGYDTTSIFNDAKFNGIMFETVISF
ncbi:hypothetical protein P8625_01965 [Tenacibaculum tangerinum]|uniref:Porin n=1 Tax=Tenacibaculum tangerinum TaxID=3038772 RepID=A0ABY8L3K2_9FLAO|nr:hypothetical protein [Tenacibaculum tangerinum]WGH75955.1 hypothetical protein P8625_01965 [Tenacibaculum tangerinum]